MSSQRAREELLLLPLLVVEDMLSIRSKRIALQLGLLVYKAVSMIFVFVFLYLLLGIASIFK